MNQLDLKKVWSIGFLAMIAVLSVGKVSTVFADDAKEVAPATSSTSTEASQNLEEQLQSLSIPENQAPLAVSREKLYSVQTRYSTLKNRLELSAGGSTGLSGTNNLTSRTAQLGLRFHITDRWSVAADYGLVYNELGGGAKKLYDDEGVLPDISYAKRRRAATLSFNTFYGKFRLTMDQVYYFDQYVSLGAGEVDLSMGTKTAVVGDAGFVFWLGKWGDVRLGLRDYYFEDQRQKTSSYVHDIHGFASFGVLLL